MNPERVELDTPVIGGIRDGTMGTPRGSTTVRFDDCVVGGADGGGDGSWVGRRVNVVVISSSCDSDVDDDIERVGGRYGAGPMACVLLSDAMYCG